MQQTAQASVSVGFLLQLYAPLAGLLVVVFWLGVLSQRVKVAERRQDATDADLKGAKAESMTVAVLASKVDDMKGLMGKMERELNGMQRSLANIASGNAGVITKFEQD